MRIILFSNLTFCLYVYYDHVIPGCCSLAEELHESSFPHQPEASSQKYTFITGVY